MMEGWSEVVPSHKATGVCEGRGAGANGLAAQRLGDIAVSLIVTVIHRAGLVLTEGRGLQSCTVTPVPSQVWRAGLAALPRNALHTLEARLLTEVLGAFAVVAKGVPVTLAAGHLQGGTAHPAGQVIYTLALFPAGTDHCLWLEYRGQVVFDVSG